jgi:hypothetical protein
MLDLSRRVLLAAALGAIAVGAAAAETRVALRGYDPVTYFTEGQPQKGVPEYTASFDDTMYWFKNAKNRDMFVANPDRYAPQYNGYCTIMVSRGIKYEADPEAWTIAENRLYVFAAKSGVDVFKEQTGSAIANANANWHATLHKQ